MPTRPQAAISAGDSGKREGGTSDGESGKAGGRESELQAVHDYVVSLQYVRRDGVPWMAATSE